MLTHGSRHPNSRQSHALEYADPWQPPPQCPGRAMSGGYRARKKADTIFVSSGRKDSLSELSEHKMSCLETRRTVPEEVEVEADKWVSGTPGPYAEIYAFIHSSNIQ